MKFLNKKFLTNLLKCVKKLQKVDSKELFTLHLSCDWFPKSTNQIHLSKADHLTVVF